MRRPDLMLLVAAGLIVLPEFSQCRGLHGERRRQQTSCRAMGLFATAGGTCALARLRLRSQSRCLAPTPSQCRP